MRLLSLYMALIVGLIASGCQSTKLTAFLPAVREYGKQPVTPLVVEPIEQAQPELTAALTSEEILVPVREKKRQSVTVATVAAVAPLRVTSDTTLKKQEAIILSSKPDPTTTAVNLIGLASTVGGLGMLIAAVASDPPSTEWGGLRNAYFGLFGLLLLISGTALLFFQGKNGRLRRLKEARREARKAVIARTSEDAPAVPSASSVIAEHHRGKVGVRLVIAAVVLLLLSLLPTFYAIITLPLAIIILPIGIVLMLQGR